MNRSMIMRSNQTIGLLLATLMAVGSTLMDQTSAASRPEPHAKEETRVEARGIQKKEDKVRVSIHDDTLYVEAESPSGIGGTRLVLTSGNWPKKIVVRLKYTPDKPFTMLEGPEATLEEKDQKDENLEVRLSPNKDGYEADLPHTERKTLHLHWIDAYR